MKIVDHQNTKIVATVGPASNSYDMLLKLVQAGVDVFRLNFSHGSHSDHAEVINHINYINEKYNLHVGILADLQGPKLRVGKIENNSLPLKPGDVVNFTNKATIKLGTNKNSSNDRAITKSRLRFSTRPIMSRLPMSAWRIH